MSGKALILKGLFPSYHIDNQSLQKIYTGESTSTSLAYKRKDRIHKKKIMSNRAKKFIIGGLSSNLILPVSTLTGLSIVKPKDL